MTVEQKMSECGVILDLDIEGSASGILKSKTFVVKDFFDVEGFVTGCGNPDWQKTHEPAVSNASCVLKLLDAGARLKGKSCTDELAFSLDGINPYYGTPLNHHLPDRIPGGSSSGSASAVSCRFVDFGIGTDTAGSIRVPASYSGLYGFRPTHGAVDISGAVPLGQSFDTVGWLSRDAETLLMVGEVLLDGGSAARSSSTGNELDASKIASAAIARSMFEMIPVEISQHLLVAADSLFDHANRAPDAEITGYTLDTCASVFGIIRSCEAWKNFGGWVEDFQPQVSPMVMARLVEGITISPEEERMARRLKQELCDYFDDLIARCGAIVLPTTWAMPPLRNATADALLDNRKKNLRLTALSVAAGLPQVSIPVEVSTGVRLGLSIIAGRNQDLALLEFAKKILV
ncbi:MAG: amidase family protein [Candidatus Melainabacteria bacterium]|nr:amidase family protein [Candidatus Melainabacteria bacterium]